MRTGRPRTPIGTHGAINTRREGGSVVAETRVRDLDGRLRQVRASGPTAAAARSRLMESIRERPSLPSSGVLRPTSSFADLADLWLADLELRDLAGNTKENYRTCLRLHVRPAFEHYTLTEVTTGRVEWFLARQATVSPSQAKQTRTLLNMLFAHALRHDAIARNPVEGTSQLRRTKPTPRALTIDQITAIRKAAAHWRSEPGLPGPKPDGQVRDIIEILLGTAMRPGEVLALRPCDIEDRSPTMIASVTGTVVHRKGSGTQRQDRPKTDASIRRIPVPEFASSDTPPPSPHHRSGTRRPARTHPSPGGARRWASSARERSRSSRGREEPTDRALGPRHPEFRPHALVSYLRQVRRPSSSPVRSASMRSNDVLWTASASSVESGLSTVRSASSMSPGES
jgi:integrase